MKEIDGRRAAAPRVAAMLESVLGCKWSVHVLAQIRAGVRRPGELTRTHPGLTAKVLNERLAKLLRFGVLDRVVHPESPPRVEYRFTDFGRRFLGLLDEVERLQHELDGDAARQSDGAPRVAPR